jgi:pimeloyl-ACP methyl ester carboxylesterase
MTKKTKEAIKASAAIVIAVVAILVLWIYPLNQAGKIVGRPEQEPAMPDPAEFGLAYDTISFVTEDNLLLAGMILSAAEEADSGSTPNSPRGMVILAHGLFEGSSSQLNKAAALAEAGFRIVIYSQRGYGQSEGKYRSGGYFEGNDLQEVIYHLDLKDLLIDPLIVWGEEHGATAAMRAWGEEEKINYVIAENPVVDGRDWQKRVRDHDERTAPNILMGLIWWWMKQKSGYEMSVDNTDISDAFGTAIVDRSDKLLSIACGNNDIPDNSYVAEMKEMGGRWLVLPCTESSPLFETEREKILSEVMALIQN